MKWKKSAEWGIFTGLFILAAVGTAFAQETTFVPGTSVNGLGISNMTIEEAASQISNFYDSEYELKILERGGAYETIDGKEIGFQVTIPTGFLEETLAAQNASGRTFGPDVDHKYKVSMECGYSETALEEKIQNLNCMKHAGSKQTSDAHISEYQEGKRFTVVPEVKGNSADTEKIAELVRAFIKNGTRELDLEAQGCYAEPKVLSSDPRLLAACQKLNQTKAVDITYSFGEETEACLDWKQIVSWITGAEDGKFLFDGDKVAAYVKQLAEMYDTAGTERVFTTVSGREVLLSGPYGWKIDQQAETDALIRVLQSGESQTRTPVYSSKAVDHEAPEWGTTYAEVDLTGQHVYMVQDGVVVWDAPCVTGNLSKGYGTPAGLYSLTYKDTDCVLRGEKRSDGTYEYESPVSYWMPFNRGIGFHDASWRGSFGGSIYKTSGSHGCINLPPNQAQGLYDRVYKGMPVICYE